MTARKDADWADDHFKRRSHSAYTLRFLSSSIIWSARLQSTIQPDNLHFNRNFRAVVLHLGQHVELKQST